MVFPLFLCHFVGEALLDQEIQETRSTQSLGQPEMRPWRLSWRVYRFKKPQWQETTPPNKQIYKQYIIPQQKLKIYKFYVVKTKNQQAHSWWFIPPINMVNLGRVYGIVSTTLAILVGGFKHFLFSISYMGCHPSHWRPHIFQDGYCTTNQISYDIPMRSPWIDDYHPH